MATTYYELLGESQVLVEHLVLIGGVDKLDRFVLMQLTKCMIWKSFGKKVIELIKQYISKSVMKDTIEFYLFFLEAQ